MLRIDVQAPSNRSIDLLSRITLQRQHGFVASYSQRALIVADFLRLSPGEFGDLVALAKSHHVLVRALEEILSMVGEEDGAMRRKWAQETLADERSRIETARRRLYEICSAFEQHGHKIAVIKSLDHWPDLGSDLDLYTDARPEDVIKLMRSIFDAEIAQRSWGDRLAHKWNFFIPGLPEAVEVHVGRLGQTGEQVAIASNLLRRSRWIEIGGHAFRTASSSDRLLISTLQRMYRHFYFRLCDIVDTVKLADAGGIDYDDLRTSAMAAGIWEGTATYLTIVSDYAANYRGTGTDLPDAVLRTARFGGEEIAFERGFLRVPIMPQSARLYGSQLFGTFGRGELHNGARLSLLPWLATAAVVGQKLTGSDKGIW